MRELQDVIHTIDVDALTFNKKVENLKNDSTILYCVPGPACHDFVVDQLVEDGRF